MDIRDATEPDFESIWAIVEPVFRAGDTYAFERNITAQEIRHIWFERPRASFVAELDGEIVGTYYIRTNNAGGGSHVCNCGYITSEAARGRGVAKAMCEHSQDVARAFGYKAMQFNFVLESNADAVRLWEQLGFDTVGRIPRAFEHPTLGLVDARVMYKWLI